eukprot:3140407-Pyramimonas_sp.AAC.1
MPLVAGILREHPPRADPIASSHLHPKASPAGQHVLDGAVGVHLHHVPMGRFTRPMCTLHLGTWVW